MRWYRGLATVVRDQEETSALFTCLYPRNAGALEHNDLLFSVLLLRENFSLPT